MKRFFSFCLLFIFLVASGLSFAKNHEDKPKTKILLLVSENGIGGTRTSWWVDDSGFSTVESNLSKLLSDLNCSIVDVKTVEGLIKRDRSLKTAELSDRESVRLGRVLRADYVVRGNAFVSSGSNIYGTVGRPFFANAAVRLICVRDGEVVADLDAIGSSLNTDLSAGGKEAFSNLAVDLAAKIISYITKEGGT